MLMHNENEKRLIDADALIDDTYILNSWDAEIVRAWLADQPTVDAVPVVHCKDCKHLALTADGEHNPEDCVCNYFLTDGLTDDDFCSRGELR